MRSIRTILFAAAIALGIFPLSSAKAQVGYYGRLGNLTGMTVGYQYRVNNGPWTTAYIAPGAVVYFGVPMSYFQTSRTAQYYVQVRYDSLVGPGEVWQAKNLAIGRANGPGSSYLNIFRRSNPYNQRVYIYLGG